MKKMLPARFLWGPAGCCCFSEERSVELDRLFWEVCTGGVMREAFVSGRG